MLGVHGVPGELRVAGGHLVAVVRNDGELVREILLLHGRLDGAVGEAVGGDRFQEQPALDEAVGAGRFVAARSGCVERDRGGVCGSGSDRGETMRQHETAKDVRSDASWRLDQPALLVALGIELGERRETAADGGERQRLFGIRHRLRHDAPGAVGEAARCARVVRARR